MSQESKAFVDQIVGQILPNFTGLDVKNARKIVKSTRKAVSKLHKEYSDLTKKIAKENKDFELSDELRDKTFDEMMGGDDEDD